MFWKLDEVAWIGRSLVSGPIRGVNIAFHGLGHTAVRTEPEAYEVELGQAGCLTVFPYCGPWTWFNRVTRTFVHELLDRLWFELKLPDTTPLIATGGSMGGTCALLYSRYARRRVAACFALFPACDLKFHYRERPDVPPSMHCAFRGYKEDFDSVLEEHSPLHQVAHLPTIPYLLIHGDADEAVNKAAHSDKMVAAMKKRGLNVEYIEVPGFGHGPLPDELRPRRVAFIRQFLSTW